MLSLTEHPAVAAKRRRWWTHCGLRTRVAAVTGAVLVLFWSILALSLLEGQRDALSHSERESVRSAQMLDAYAALLLDRATRALNASKSTVENFLDDYDSSHPHDPATLSRRLYPWIAESLARAPLLSFLAVLDGDQQLLAVSASSGPIDTTAKRSIDPGLAAWIRSSKETGSAIGPAIDLLGDDSPTLPVIQSLTTSDGSFAGTLLVGIPISVLDRLYLTAGIGCCSTIELRGRGNALLYHFTPPRREGSTPPSGTPRDALGAELLRYSATSADSYLRTTIVVPRHAVVKSMQIPLAVGGAITIGILLFSMQICRHLQDRNAEEQRRRRAERKLLDAIDATSDIFVEFDASMRIVEVSHRIERVAGLRPSDLVGIAIDQMRGEPADSDGAKAFRAAVAARQAFRDVVAPMTLPGGRGVWVRASGKPILDDQGAFQGYRCMISDVTEHESRKSAQFHQDRLMSLGQLAGGIAHDFNNLLSSILGFGKLLEEDLRDDPPKLKLIDRVIASTNRAKDLVQHIVSFARLGSTTAEHVDVASVVDDVSLLLRSSLPPSTRLDIENRLTKTAVRIERNRLTQVLVNLCTNANDALEGRDGTVGITSESAAPEDPAYRLLSASANTEVDRLAIMLNHQGADVVLVGRLDTSIQYVHLSISDTGSGISRNDLSRIFEPYFTTKAIGKGGGLGLSVVHGIVLAAGGALAITTSRRNGTIVDVFLPISHEECDSSDRRGQTSRSLAQGSTVMVVDDQREVRDVVAISLERAGMKVVSFGSGFDALAAFQADPQKWDAVLSDHGMPGMRGAELIRIIKSQQPELPCVLSTGYATAPDELLPQAGADCLLQKPLRPEVIQDTVSQLIAKSRRSSVAA